jgi:hypothetical protein
MRLVRAASNGAPQCTEWPAELEAGVRIGRWATATGE